MKKEIIKINSLCVFCGSRMGENSSYARFAKDLAKWMAEKDISLIYGGASIGIMGVVADEMISLGGEVHGIMPELLVKREVAHKSLPRFTHAIDMHDRKKKMYDLSDAFIALPGGFGTLDEICEIITWRQLKQHQKPCIIANVDGFYDHFITHLKHAQKDGFMDKAHIDMLSFVTSIEELDQLFL